MSKKDSIKKLKNTIKDFLFRCSADKVFEISEKLELRNGNNLDKTRNRIIDYLDKTSVQDLIKIGNEINLRIPGELRNYF